MKKSLVTNTLLLLAFATFAQEKGVHAFSLKEAIDYALQNNANVKNARLDEQKAKAYNWEILTQGLPQVSGSLEYDYYFKTPQVPALTQYFDNPTGTFSQLLAYVDTVNNHKIGNIIGPNGLNFNNISFVLPNSLSTNLQVTQLLFDARYMFGIRARKDLYKTSRLERELSEQDIRYAVTKAYYQAETAQESQSLLNENLKILDKLLSDTRTVFEQGLTEELDVDRLELAKVTLESQINLQKQLANVGLENLKFQLGLPLDDELILKDKLDYLRSSSNLSAETNFDPQNRVEYELLKTAITLKGYDVAQKRSGYYPSLAGFVNYGWDVQTQNFNDMFSSITQYNADGTTSKISPWYPQGFVGISLKVPIFDSGLKMAQVKQAKLEQIKSANDFENFKNAAKLQYEAALEGFNAAVIDEVNSQKALDLSKKIFDKNQVKFKAGAGSSFELAQSEQDFTTNQLKHMQSIMNLLNAKADLDKAMGVK